MNKTGQGQDTASETDRGQFDNREYSTEVGFFCSFFFYNGTNQEFDSESNEDSRQGQEGGSHHTGCCLSDDCQNVFMSNGVD